MIVVAITTVVTSANSSCAAVATTATTAATTTAAVWIVRIEGMCARARTVSSRAIGPSGGVLDDV